ncbi:hypothetical protein MMC22_011705 [Lobaria immixta]|nr:hypothetical protein [Lobaria immixta]
MAANRSDPTFCWWGILEALNTTFLCSEGARRRSNPTASSITSNTKKIILSKSADWDPWISFVRARASNSDIWDLVKPNLDNKPLSLAKPTEPTEIESDQDELDTQIPGINITPKDTPTKTSHLITPDPTPEPTEIPLPQSPTSDAEMSSISETSPAPQASCSNKISATLDTSNILPEGVSRSRRSTRRNPYVAALDKAAQGQLEVFHTAFSAFISTDTYYNTDLKIRLDHNYYNSSRRTYKATATSAPQGICATHTTPTIECGDERVVMSSRITEGVSVGRQSDVGRHREQEQEGTRSEEASHRQ